jgi:hypothetical protein
MTYEGDGGYTDGYIDGYTAVTSQWMTRETAGSNALRHLTKIDDVFDEPDWIADLLEDFDAGSMAGSDCKSPLRRAQRSPVCEFEAAARDGATMRGV